MPKCYVLVGVPGSGKSTWVNNQYWADSCVYISTDQYVEIEAVTQGKTYSEVFDEYMPTAVNLMVEDVKAASETDKDIIWDQTSTTLASRRRKFNMLPEYEMIAVVFDTPPRQVLETRLASRPGKVIPMTVLTDMIENFESVTEDEGFKEIWYAD